MKIVHDKFRSKKTLKEKEEFRRTFDSALRLGGGQDVNPHLNKAMDDLNPLRVLDLFRKISDEVRLSVVVC